MNECKIEFILPQDVSSDLSLYYELSNFYQNHRRYISSQYPTQLEGQSIAKALLAPVCDPMTTNGSLILNPCGLIANSFFTGYGFEINSLIHNHNNWLYILI